MGNHEEDSEIFPSVSQFLLFREAWFQYSLKNPGFPWQTDWAKAQWYTLHPSEGSLPRHNLMANLAITANSLFPQMSQRLGTWASMHMHTHSPLAQHSFCGDSVCISLKMACCPTLYLHVSVGMATCMFLHGMFTGWLSLIDLTQLRAKTPDWYVYYTLTQSKKM